MGIGLNQSSSYSITLKHLMFEHYLKVRQVMIHNRRLAALSAFVLLLTVYQVINAIIVMNRSLNEIIEVSLEIRLLLILGVIKIVIACAGISAIIQLNPQKINRYADYLTFYTISLLIFRVVYWLVTDGGFSKAQVMKMLFFIFLEACIIVIASVLAYQMKKSTQVETERDIEMSNKALKGF
mmetsp:Transcript_13153/g.14507  ORF Transcript_13153/g.14507 Transcript_13153/m.14507 type:complete len:182 (+) Transcript_13153:418-963(+)|eukprot:CAMPEP_0115035830 /NCGR_PEP_ID=MMETSP0216-20121206/41733_1 /TAXON_ID=223996 /ORGANISM="Protocruzia adherens, Strain Boccale" /LENGTH=181 /DNA_ID=CAMNT_0002415487 /DNA_START=419 /DNA_END=964 /DNA_ORIENTATION=-